METYEYVYGENSGIEKRTDDAGVSREVIGWRRVYVPLQVFTNAFDLIRVFLAWLACCFNVCLVLHAVLVSVCFTWW